MTVLTLDQAQIDSNELTNQLRRYINVMAEIDALKEDVKAIVQEAVDKNKMEKKLVNSYFRARYKAQTKEVAEQGAIFSAIDNLLDN